MGKFFINQLKDDLGNLKIVREIRGMGLMIGIELKKPNLPVVKDCLEKQNLLLNLTSSNIVRMLPPLIIKKGQLKTISKKLKFVLESYE
jgi:acetylornithine/N-succinyldiaminopimelate aminotransferase